MFGPGVSHPPTRNHVQNKNSTAASANPSNLLGQQEKTEIENILQF